MTQTRAQTKTGIGEAGEPPRHRVVLEYDATVDSAVVGTVPMRGDSLPLGAVVVDALLHVDTIAASGGSATVAIQAESANDIATQAAFNAAPFSTTGAKRATLTSTSTPVKTTVDRQPSVVIGTANLTALRLRLVLDYYLMTA